MISIFKSDYRMNSKTSLLSKKGTEVKSKLKSFQLKFQRWISISKNKYQIYGR